MADGLSVDEMALAFFYRPIDWVDRELSPDHTDARF